LKNSFKIWEKMRVVISSIGQDGKIAVKKV
jgi:hypothetical protein